MTVSNTGYDQIPPEFTKLVFDLWLELGSLKKIENRLRQEGYRNSRGNFYPASHLNAIANRYILENFDTVDIKGIIDKDLANIGKPPLTQDQFELFLMQKAITLWGKKAHKQRFFDWIEKHGFQKYQSMWVEQGVPANAPSKRFTLAERYT